MKNLTLVIMAAGMGSRFGGLKQIEPVGPNGEIIAEYSIYDAIRAGFNKVIFIIRKEHLDYFKNNICNKFASQIEILYAFQELEYIPKGKVLPENRTKMLGTAHALYCASDLIESDFVVINADDFYGKNSYEIAAKFLENNYDKSLLLTVNYPFIVTNSPNGSVKRGVVIEKNGYLKDNLECEIIKEADNFVAKPLDGSKEFKISAAQPVSVNFFCLRKEFLSYIKEELERFLDNDITLENEFLLPTVIKHAIDDQKFKMKIATSQSKWMGMTYKEDLYNLQENIKKLIERGEYPSNLWK